MITSLCERSKFNRAENNASTVMKSTQCSSSLENPSIQRRDTNTHQSKCAHESTAAIDLSGSMRSIANTRIQIRILSLAEESEVRK
jgi:hypothetical protein